MQKKLGGLSCQNSFNAPWQKQHGMLREMNGILVYLGRKGYSFGLYILGFDYVVPFARFVTFLRHRVTEAEESGPKSPDSSIASTVGSADLNKMQSGDSAVIASIAIGASEIAPVVTPIVVQVSSKLPRAPSKIVRSNSGTSKKYAAVGALKYEGLSQMIGDVEKE